jgi:hypothetical protein
MHLLHRWWLLLHSCHTCVLLRSHAVLLLCSVISFLQLLLHACSLLLSAAWALLLLCNC